MQQYSLRISFVLTSLMIINQNQFFAGKRKGSHGSGTLALPGGHLEFGETWEECAVREVLEETGLHVHNLRFVHATNDPMLEENKHYVTIFMLCECVHSGNQAVPKNLEPHKCEGWDSYSWNDFRAILHAPDEYNVKLFGPFKHLIEQIPPSTVEDWFK